MIAQSPKDLVCLGVVTSPHGVRGQVKIKYYTQEPEGLISYGHLYDAKGNVTFDIVLKGEAKGLLIASIKGVNDRNAAERLKGTEFFVPREALPETESGDEFYYEDLVGMDVMLESGEVFGRVLQVHNHGAGDLLEIMRSDGKKEFFSFSKASFPQIDLQKRTILFNPPEEIIAKED